MSYDPNDVYRPPASPLQQPQGDHAWFEGNYLVVRKGAGIPTHRCVRCGDPASKTMSKRFGWHPSWVWVILLAGLLVYVIVAMCLTKRGTLMMGLCPKCAGRRRNIILSGVLGSIVLFIAMVLAFSAESVGLGFLLLLGWFIYSAVFAVIARTLVPVFIDDYIMRFKGADPKVLEPGPF